MKFVPMFSAIYFSSSVVISFVYPTLFVPTTVAYVFCVGEYEILTIINEKWGGVLSIIQKRWGE